MNRDYFKGFVRVGIFIGGTALVLLLFEPRDRPEWTVSLCSVLIGAAIVLGAFALDRFMK
ncbi:MAG TPA: hypothetical protein VHD90_22960 [Phototrophicaceae bacterium]|nr:hypothetical protein [Phototrophicaceae bacterium]